MDIQSSYIQSFKRGDVTLQASELSEVLMSSEVESIVVNKTGTVRLDGKLCDYVQVEIFKCLIETTEGIK